MASHKYEIINRRNIWCLWSVLFVSRFKRMAWSHNWGQIAYEGVNTVPDLSVVKRCNYTTLVIHFQLTVLFLIYRTLEPQSTACRRCWQTTPLPEENRRSASFNIMRLRLIHERFYQPEKYSDTGPDLCYWCQGQASEKTEERANIIISSPG